jgi:uncharacterized protein (DUF927 family)
VSPAASPQPADGPHVLPTPPRPDGLTPADLAVFARLRIPEELMVEARVRRVNDALGRELTGRRDGDMAGIVFDYPDVATGRVVSHRVRRDNPEIEHGKPKNKYVSGYGGRKRLYFPPGAAAKLQDADTPIVLVESEKSALALTAWAERTGRKLLAVATGGCYGWRGRIGKALTPSGKLVDEKGPSADLRVCNGRRVYVMLDANVSTSRDVQQAQVALVRELSSRDCTVLVSTIPTVDGVNGPDDYVGKCGDDALAQVLDSARPTVASCDYAGGRFELTDKGVIYIGPPDKEGNPKPPQWICSPLFVVASTRTNKSDDWGCLLKWQDKDNVSHQWAMPSELLQRDGGVEVRCELARQGLTISPGRAARELLSTFLQVWPVDGRARCVDRLGWHNGAYILPAEVIGNAGQHVVFQNVQAVEPAFAIAGTTAEWREHVAALAQGNSRTVFSISAAFASPLLEPAGEDSGGFHFRGASSTGKTKGCLMPAASVWGFPGDGSNSYCRKWRATTNGLEGLAALHNDGLLILDELNQMDAREAGEAAYLLANGQGKARAARNGTARQPASWRLLFLSAGEQSLSALMAQAGKKPTAGQEIRMAEIEADADMGVVEELHGHNGPANLIQALKDAALTHYGAVGMEWLRRLPTDRDKVGKVLAEGIRRFVEECAPRGASGQVERVGRRFGLVAMAGEIATRYGLTGWTEHEAEKAAGKCFASWLAHFGAGNREEWALLEQVRGFIEREGASRFQRLGNDAQQVRDRAGFVRDAEDGATEYLVLPETFRREVCAGFPTEWAVKVLQQHGWLGEGNEGRDTLRLKKAPGMKSPRVYLLTAKMWDEGGEE